MEKDNTNAAIIIIITLGLFWSEMPHWQSFYAVSCSRMQTSFVNTKFFFCKKYQIFYKSFLPTFLFILINFIKALSRSYLRKVVYANLILSLLETSSSTIMIERNGVIIFHVCGVIFVTCYHENKTNYTRLF